MSVFEAARVVSCLFVAWTSGYIVEHYGPGGRHYRCTSVVVALQNNQGARDGCEAETPPSMEDATVADEAGAHSRWWTRVFETVRSPTLPLDDQSDTKLYLHKRPSVYSASRLPDWSNCLNSVA